MAPNFLSKFVGGKGGASPASDHSRLRTSSDIGPVRAAATFTAPISTPNITPSVVLTSDNSDSPIQPSTPDSLHRSDSSAERRTRSVSLTPSSRSRPSPVSTPRKAGYSIDGIPETDHHIAQEASTGAAIGLGIDLGASKPPGLGLNSNELTAPNGDSHMIKHKSSNKSLRSLVNTKRTEDPPPLPATVTQHGDEQEIILPPRAGGVRTLVESPTSDSTPTTASFSSPAMDGETATVSIIAPSVSTTSQSSLQPPLKDGDAMSVASGVSANKKMPWRRGSASSSKRRKPTGLASAIAATGLAMANPAVAQPLTQFAPPPPNSPPRSQPNPQSPHRRTISGGGGAPPTSRKTSNGNRTRVRAGSESLSIGENGNVNGDQFYSDEESDDEGELDLDNDIPVTGFAVASSSRNAEFHKMFPQVPEGDYLIEDYGCALQREILIQGRMYISENHICFHANIFGWITDLIVPVYDILSIEKKMTALFIPNAIQITTRQAKYTFASFLSRDTTYDVIHNVWRSARPDAESIISGEASARGSLEDPSLRELAGTAETSLDSAHKATECECTKIGTHYPETAMVAIFPGTPEQIYNLMFASGFIKRFLVEDQKLLDLQMSDWCPNPDTKLLSRHFSYIKILNGVVSKTKCELSDETLHCDFDDYITMQTTTRTPDVPSGSAFSVKTRTCIMWAGPCSSKVVVTTQVEWTGRSFIKSMINSSAIDGQKTYHVALEKAMRQYIAEHKNEFVIAGMEDVVETPVVEAKISSVDETAVSRPVEVDPKRREQERNQRATQWAFDTLMGAWKVAKQSTAGAIELVSDAWDQSSSTTILYFVIVLLVISNLWSFSAVGRREEIGRRKEMLKTEEQKKLVTTIVSALWEEQRLAGRRPGAGGEVLLGPVPTTRDGLGWKEEVAEISKALDFVEERISHMRTSLKDLD